MLNLFSIQFRILFIIFPFIAFLGVCQINNREKERHSSKININLILREKNKCWVNFIYFCAIQIRFCTSKCVFIQEKLSYEKDKFCFDYRGKRVFIWKKNKNSVKEKKLFNHSVKIKEIVSVNHLHSRYISFNFKYITRIYTNVEWHIFKEKSFYIL